MRDSRMHRCVACTIAIHILVFMPFEVSDFPDLLARLPARFCSTKSASLHNMKPKRERSNGVGPSRLGCISSPLHVHRKEGLLPVPDEC